MTTNLRSNNHSVFDINFHLVLTTKYRRKVIDDAISDRAREIFEYVGANHKVSIVEWNHDRDHIHVLLTAEPKTNMSKFLNAYKSASSRLLKKEFPRIRTQLWKEMFWSRSFCLISAGGAPLETLKKYIQSQGEPTR